MEDLTAYTVDEHGAISEPQAVKTYAIPRPNEIYHELRGEVAHD